LSQSKSKKGMPAQRLVFEATWYSEYGSLPWYDIKYISIIFQYRTLVDDIINHRVYFPSERLVYERNNGSDGSSNICDRVSYQSHLGTTFSPATILPSLFDFPVSSGPSWGSTLSCVLIP